jgi:hypothetical protein
LQPQRVTTVGCRVAFIPFLCAGDPDLDTTAAAVKKLDEVGADVIELGVPYSVSVTSRVPGLARLAAHVTHGGINGRAINVATR